jgi:hypothetical protein
LPRASGILGVPALVVGGPVAQAAVADHVLAGRAGPGEGPAVADRELGARPSGCVAVGGLPDGFAGLPTGQAEGMADLLPGAAGLAGTADVVAGGVAGAKLDVPGGGRAASGSTSRTVVCAPGNSGRAVIAAPWPAGAPATHDAARSPCEPRHRSRRQRPRTASPQWRKRGESRVPVAANRPASHRLTPAVTRSHHRSLNRRVAPVGLAGLACLLGHVILPVPGVVR